MKTKKLVLFILIAVIILSICNPTNAATSYVVELKSNATTVKQGKEVEITISVKDIVDISGGIAGLSAKLKYDTTKLEKIGDGQSLNGFLLVEGETIELAKYPGVTAETEIAKFTFKAKNTATGNTQITLSDVEVVNGTDTFPLGKDVTKTISITSDNTQSEPLSSNNNLTSISIDGVKISSFAKDTLTYTLATVENEKTSINISAEAEDKKAQITGNGIKELNIGKNNFSINVTAEDGKQKTYTITIERKSQAINNENTQNNTKNEKDKTQHPAQQLPNAGSGTFIFIGIITTVIIILIINYFKVKKLSGI